MIVTRAQQPLISRPNHFFQVLDLEFYILVVERLDKLHRSTRDPESNKCIIEQPTGFYFSALGPSTVLKVQLVTQVVAVLLQTS